MRRYGVMRLLLCLPVALLAGCAARAPVLPAASAVPAVSPSFLDLQSGWRLRVVTPLLRSGGYRVVAETPKQESGGTLTLEVGKDFIGYETSYYSVQPRRGAGVRIAFTSAEAVRDGKTAPEDKPVVPLFQLPGSARRVRLLYLVRVSQADHNMAVLAAQNEKAIDELTRQVQRDPSVECRASKVGVCAWIPAGIAVRAEMPKDGDAPGVWVPAR